MTSCGSLPSKKRGIKIDLQNKYLLITHLNGRFAEQINVYHDLKDRVYHQAEGLYITKFRKEFVYHHSVGVYKQGAYHADKVSIPLLCVQ